MPPRRTCSALAAALTLLPGCADLVPWNEPTVRTFVSAAVPQCPAADSLCAVLTPLPPDSLLLAQLGHVELDEPTGMAQLTGMSWTEPEVGSGALHLMLPPAPEGETRAVYVLETLRAESAHDSLLSIASNGGAVVWLNGELLGASRSAARAARAHQDLYTASLRQGTNVLLLRILSNGPDTQLHREWHAETARPDLLAAAIELGAYATLMRTPLLPDTATGIELWPRNVRLRDGPVVHLTWRTLLGDSLGDGGRHADALPGRLAFPPGFRGMALLQTEVLDPGGRRLYFDQSPVVLDSTARRLARELATDTTAADPVRLARVDAVRAAFNLGSAPRGTDPGAWIKAQVLASLYQHVRQPSSFQWHPGPQVWGYRAADGSVQPYWLVVPPTAVEPAGPTGDPPGLVFSLTHMVDPDFWVGRGRVGGFLVALATMGSSHGTFGVLPHLRGLTDLDSAAVREVPAITRQVASAFTIDTAAVGMLAWSSHARESLEMALVPGVPIAWLGMAVPRLYRNEQELASTLDSLAVLRPRLRFLVWQASQDTVVRQESTEHWVRQARRRGFDVRYRVVPWSTHLGGYYDNIEADLHRSMALRYRGAAGRALRDSLAAEAAAAAAAAAAAPRP